MNLDKQDIAMFQNTRTSVRSDTVTGKTRDIRKRKEELQQAGMFTFVSLFYFLFFVLIICNSLDYNFIFILTL